MATIVQSCSTGFCQSPDMKHFLLKHYSNFCCFSQMLCLWLDIHHILERKKMKLCDVCVCFPDKNLPGKMKLKTTHTHTHIGWAYEATRKSTIHTPPGVDLYQTNQDFTKCNKGSLLQLLSWQAASDSNWFNKQLWKVPSVNTQIHIYIYLRI